MFFGLGLERNGKNKFDWLKLTCPDKNFYLLSITGISNKEIVSKISAKKIWGKKSYATPNFHPPQRVWLCKYSATWLRAIEVEVTRSAKKTQNAAATVFAVKYYAVYTPTNYWTNESCLQDKFVLDGWITTDAFHWLVISKNRLNFIVNLI